MPLSNLDRRRRIAQETPPLLREATILDPPLSDEGWMRVELDDQPGVERLCPWDPRADGIAPAPDDAAVVIESDAGNWWVVQWWPQTGAAAVPPHDPTAIHSGDAAGGDLNGTLPNPIIRATEPWHVVGSAGEPAFGAGFSALGGANMTPRFCKDRMGWVWVAGAAKAGASTIPSGSTVFTLPVGYRPSATLIFDPAAAAFAVDLSGNIKTGVGLLANQPVYLSAIRFRQEG